MESMGLIAGRRKDLVVLFAILGGLLGACGVKLDTSHTMETKIHTISLRNTNVYLVERAQRLLMIDAGYAKDSVRLYEAIEELGYNPESIEYLILTHAHGDHVGSAAFFRNKSGCQIIAGAPDQPFLRSGKQVDICPVNLMARILTLGMKEDFPPIDPDTLVKDDQRIKLEAWDMEIEVVAGHTPGSLICHAPYGVFVGDLVRGRPLAKNQPARHYFMCDIEDNNNDLRSLYDRTAENVLWYPGHFGPISRVLPEDL